MTSSVRFWIMSEALVECVVSYAPVLIDLIHLNVALCLYFMVIDWQQCREGNDFKANKKKSTWNARVTHQNQRNEKLWTLPLMYLINIIVIPTKVTVIKRNDPNFFPYYIVSIFIWYLCFPLLFIYFVVFLKKCGRLSNSKLNSLIYWCFKHNSYTQQTDSKSVCISTAALVDLIMPCSQMLDLKSQTQDKQSHFNEFQNVE